MDDGGGPAPEDAAEDDVLLGQLWCVYLFGFGGEERRPEVEGFSCCCCGAAWAPAAPPPPPPPRPPPSSTASVVVATAETENSEGRIAAPSLPARIAAPKAEGLSLPSSQKLSIADAETLLLLLLLFVDLRAASA